MLNWAQAVLLPYRLSFVSFGIAEKNLHSVEKKEYPVAKENGMKKGIMGLLLPSLFL